MDKRYSTKGRKLRLSSTKRSRRSYNVAAALAARRAMLISKRAQAQVNSTTQEVGDVQREPHGSSQVEGPEGSLEHGSGSSGVPRDEVENGRSPAELEVPDHEQNGVPKIVYCDFCKYWTKHPGHLKAHLRVHTGEKPYACDACEYRATSIANLRRHCLTHMGLKPYTCDVCGHTARSTSNLKVHMRIHSGERSFVCNTCDYRTNDTTKLKRHILKSHSEGRKCFNCEFCSFTTGQCTEFKRHMKTHVQEEKLFFCHLCEYRCPSATSLKVHIRIHTGEKPFVCSACPYRASTGPQLKVHMRTHTGEKPYGCQVCGYKFKQLPGLKRHIKRLHPTYPHPDMPEVADFSYVPTGSDDLLNPAGDVTVGVKGVDAEVSNGGASDVSDVTAGSIGISVKEVADNKTDGGRRLMASDMSESEVKNVTTVNDVEVKEEQVVVYDYFSSDS